MILSALIARHIAYSAEPLTGRDAAFGLDRRMAPGYCVTP
jgi:hypothetical protein